MTEVQIAALRGRERAIERQTAPVAEMTASRDRLDQVALLNLPPDLNDGLVIGIAPLHELLPWSEAGKHWKRLLGGEYEWSKMSVRMRDCRLVQAT